MRERNIICVHYERAGVCAISKKECMVQGLMQHCGKYEPRKGSQPIRANQRRKKLERAKRSGEEI